MTGRKRLGLALGGGVARGLAHIGVIAVLKEAGIPIDCVSGTSAGAIVAALLCAGMEASEMEERASRLRWSQLVSLGWPRRGLVRFDRLAHWMIQELGDLDFADLRIPCALGATDLERGEAVSLCEGSLAQAVQASCSVPGFVEPFEWQGRLLCDGATSDVLPVEALRRMGAEYVIAVNVFAVKVWRWLGPLGYGWAGLEGLLANSGGGARAADCLITPDVAGMTYLRFSKYKELIEAGRKAALGKLPTLRRDLELEASEGAAPGQAEGGAEGA